jgi:hypothetical protein
MKFHETERGEKGRALEYLLFPRDRILRHEPFRVARIGTKTRSLRHSRAANRKSIAVVIARIGREKVMYREKEKDERARRCGPLLFAFVGAVISLFNALGVNSFPFVMFNHMFIRVRSSAIN